jgi:hypothetical protein
MDVDALRAPSARTSARLPADRDRRDRRHHLDHPSTRSPPSPTCATSSSRSSAAPSGSTSTAPTAGWRRSATSCAGCSTGSTGPTRSSPTRTSGCSPRSTARAVRPRRRHVLTRAFSLVPEYLTTDDEGVTDYMDWGVQLGRRFRALKLWMVMRYFGADGLAARIRHHVAQAQRVARGSTRTPTSSSPPRRRCRRCASGGPGRGRGRADRAQPCAGSRGSTHRRGLPVAHRARRPVRAAARVGNPTPRCASSTPRAPRTCVEAARVGGLDVVGSRGDLLSHRVAPAVPSALEGLTSGFGMCPGVSPPLGPREICGCEDVCGCVPWVFGTS